MILLKKNNYTLGTKRTKKKQENNKKNVLERKFSSYYP